MINWVQKSDWNFALQHAATKFFCHIRTYKQPDIFSSNSLWHHLERCLHIYSKWEQIHWRLLTFITHTVSGHQKQLRGKKRYNKKIDLLSGKIKRTYVFIIEEVEMKNCMSFYESFHCTKSILCKQ